MLYVQTSTKNKTTKTKRKSNQNPNPNELPRNLKIILYFLQTLRIATSSSLKQHPRLPSSFARLLRPPLYGGTTTSLPQSQFQLQPQPKSRKDDGPILRPHLPRNPRFKALKALTRTHRRPEILSRTRRRSSILPSPLLPLSPSQSPNPIQTKLISTETVYPPPPTPHPIQENPSRTRRRKKYHRLPKVPAQPTLRHRIEKPAAIDECIGD